MYTPPRPSVEKYTHRTTDRADERTSGADEGSGARRPTDRPVRCPRWRARRMTTRRRVDIERRGARGRAREHAMKKTSAPDRGTTVAVVRAEGSDVDGKTTGLVRPRRMRRDATTARDDHRAWGGVRGGERVDARERGSAVTDECVMSRSGRSGRVGCDIRGDSG